MKILIDFEDGFKKEFSIPDDVARHIMNSAAGFEIVSCHPFYAEILNLRIVPIPYENDYSVKKITH